MFVVILCWFLERQFFGLFSGLFIYLYLCVYSLFLSDCPISIFSTLKQEEIKKERGRKWEREERKLLVFVRTLSTYSHPLFLSLISLISIGPANINEISIISSFSLCCVYGTEKGPTHCHRYHHQKITIKSSKYNNNKTKSTSRTLVQCRK